MRLAKIEMGLPELMRPMILFPQAKYRKQIIVLLQHQKFQNKILKIFPKLIFKLLMINA